MMSHSLTAMVFAYNYILVFHNPRANNSHSDLQTELMKASESEYLDELVMIGNTVYISVILCMCICFFYFKGV
jgi:hypothetical protein